MICHVVIHDFEVGRRMLYVLDDEDFAIQQALWHQSDALLTTLQNHSFFAGHACWCDLEIKHFHVMIVNILKMLSSLDDETRGDQANPLVRRLAFVLCCLISVIQERTGSIIELLRVNRVMNNDVIYDYNATLDVTIEPMPGTGLKVVIDNDGC